MQAHRNEGIVKDIFLAAMNDLDQQQSDLFMKNSVITDPDRWNKLLIFPI